MKVNIKRVNHACHLEAQNEEGVVIHVDGAPEIGGQNLGFRPMQLLLAGIGSCSSMDIISILRKQKQDLKQIEVEVNGEREKDRVPSLFTHIDVHFRVRGMLDENKVKHAIALSMDKYCSVAKILEKTARIRYSYEVVNN